MVLILLCLVLGSFSLSCLDSSGSPQDYWVMLKAPEVAGVPPVPGKAYMYIDRSHLSPVFNPQPLNLTSAMTATLGQLNTDSTISYILYK